MISEVPDALAERNRPSVRLASGQMIDDLLSAHPWLTFYRTTQQSVALRLYQRVLLPHREAGNAYWRKLVLE
jgi:hypothetical protein